MNRGNLTQHRRPLIKRNRGQNIAKNTVFISSPQFYYKCIIQGLTIFPIRDIQGICYWICKCRPPCRSDSPFSALLKHKHIVPPSFQSWKPSTISVRLYFLKCIHIFISSKLKSVQKVCLDFLVSNVNLYSVEKSGQNFCTDLRPEENENLDTFEKIWTHRNCWGFPSLLLETYTQSATW